MELRSADLPPLAGSPGLAQSVYGDVGNLELLAPASDGGMWVFWFNADEVEHRQGAVRGGWSGGLHIFEGHDVTAARISQVAAGPRFLEAVALMTDGSLHRLYWTPDDGFVHAGVVAENVAATSSIVESAGLHLLAVTSEATVLHLHAALTGYPSVRWTSQPVAHGATAVVLSPDLTAAVLIDGTAHVLGYAGEWRYVRTVEGPWRDVSLAGDVVLGLDEAGRFAGIHARAITATRTTLDGGRIDVVLAVPDGLMHLHGDGRVWSEPRLIRSEVWVDS